MNRLKNTTVIFLAVFLLPIYAFAALPSRGLFIWSLEKEPVLSSVGQMERSIAFAKQHGIDTIFLQVYRGNKSWFASTVADDEPYRTIRRQVGQDPLQLFIDKAHAQGIQVHAWLNMLSLGGNDQAPLLLKYGPSILTRNRDPKKTLADYKIDNQYFLEPSDKRVVRASLAVVEEMISKYPTLDGIQFDYIRYPDVHPFYGYSPDNIVRYKRAANKNTVVESDPTWKQWKRDQVTALLKQLINKARLIHPNIHVSTTGCLAYGRAIDEALQDWPSWINSGLTEFVTVMNYPPDRETYQKNIDGIRPHVKDMNKVNIAVGAYKHIAKPAVFHEQLQACEAAKPRGCVLFHYNNFLENPELTP